jgi:putative DNA-invertase from lambdoid prophage Rac
VATLNELTALGVVFVSMTEALDLSTPSGRALAGMLAVFAEFERDLLRERVRGGLERARREGKHLGRPPTAATHAPEVRALRLRDLSHAEIARRVGIGETSVRRILANKRPPQRHRDAGAVAR